MVALSKIALSPKTRQVEGCNQSRKTCERLKRSIDHTSQVIKAIQVRPKRFADQKDYFFVSKLCFQPEAGQQLSQLLSKTDVLKIEIEWFNPASFAAIGYWTKLWKYMFKRRTAEILVNIQENRWDFDTYWRKPLKKLSMFTKIADIMIHISRKLLKQWYIFLINVWYIKGLVFTSSRQPLKP